jgi:ABC-type branched-subunit amino acid transport system substrate-binding protein
LSALLAAACGSTVATTASTSTANGLGGPAVASGAAPDGTGALPGTDNNTGTTALPAGEAPTSLGTTTVAGTGSTTTGTSTVAGSRPVRDSLTGRPGVTPTTIKIGLELDGDAAATRAAFGLPAAKGPTAQQGFKIMFDYINAHGGFGGRKAVMEVVETDVKEGTVEAQAQAACTKFTEDLKVFAVVASVARSTTMFDCLAQHKTIGMPYYPGLAFSAQSWDRLKDYLYAPNYLAVQRGGIIVDSWVHLGLLTKTSAIGLISVDEPVRQQFAAQVRARLKDYGFTAKDEFKMSNVHSVSDLSGTSAEMSNAVLKFRSEGIDRVLFANTGGGGPTFFMPAAENQGYAPSYGISTYEFLRTLVQLAPAAALERSDGAGWSPAHDITNTKYLPKNPARDKCAAIFKGKITFTDTTMTSIGGICEPLLVLRDALDNVARGSPGFRQGFEALGRYNTPYSDPLLFAPGRRHDGISMYRDFRWQKDCGCFYYVDGPFAIP